MDWCRKCCLFVETLLDGGLFENRGHQMVEKLHKCSKCGLVIRKEWEHYESKTAKEEVSVVRELPEEDREPKKVRSVKGRK